jgi:hypothetical protein
MDDDLGGTHHYNRRACYDDWRGWRVNFRMTFEMGLSVMMTVVSTVRNKTAAGGDQTYGADE